MCVFCIFRKYQSGVGWSCGQGDICTSVCARSELGKRISERQSDLPCFCVPVCVCARACVGVGMCVHVVVKASMRMHAHVCARSFICSRVLMSL